MGFLDRFEPLELTGSTPPHDRVDQLLDVTVDQLHKIYRDGGQLE